MPAARLPFSDESYFYLFSSFFCAPPCVVCYKAEAIYLVTDLLVLGRDKAGGAAVSRVSATSHHISHKKTLLVQKIYIFSNKLPSRCMGDPVKDKKVYFCLCFGFFFWETELCLGFRGQYPRGLYVDTKSRVGGLFCYLEQGRKKENVGFRVFCWGNKGMSFGGKYLEGCTSCYITSTSHKRKGKSVISLSYLICSPITSISRIAEKKE